MELLPNMQDQMARLTKDLKKSFYSYFSERAGSRLRAYFRANNWADMVEPRDVKQDMFEICRLIKAASQCTDILTVGVKVPQAKRPMA